ncbi:MAG: fibronectin-binding protein [Candidatus Nitrosocaldaceae archaeon]|nr:MAG: fibronectin-binding protein [Candidatus Nitrosocaldaceae archaeon]
MLTALELSNLIDKINSLIDGKEYYVSKIYPILDDTFLFKLHHAFENDIFLVVSSIGIWITRYMFKDSKPSYFFSSLNRLTRCKLLNIKQFNNDRIARFKFLDKVDNEDVIFYLFVELFGNGNIILCDSNMRIIATLKKNRRLKIGAKYTVDIDHRIDPLKIEYEDLYPLLDADDIEEWFVSNIALPNSIIKMVIGDANLDKVRDKRELDRLYSSLIKVRDEFLRGKRSLLVDDTNNYLEAIDRKFSSIIVDRLEKEVDDSKRDELIRIINRKEAKRLELIRRAKEIRGLADRFASNNINDDDIKQVIALGIDNKGSVYSIASKLYDRAKGLERGIKKIEESIKKSKDELAKIKETTIKIDEKRDREWFERYRWFITSDNLLAVGGRDASSNDVLLNKYAKNDDLVFHADIYGSPFFILKEAKVKSINEVAIATASFSRAWREGFNSLDVFYVKKEQLKKTNKKGAYVVSGKRNYLKNIELKLGIGIIKYEGKKYLISAPVDIFDKCIVIKPGYDDRYKAAKEIRDRLSELDKEFIDSISIDDIIKILPSGNLSII